MGRWHRREILRGACRGATMDTGVPPPVLRFSTQLMGRRKKAWPEPIRSRPLTSLCLHHQSRPKHLSLPLQPHLALDQSRRRRDEHNRRKPDRMRRMTLTVTRMKVYSYWVVCVGMVDDL